MATLCLPGSTGRCGGGGDDVRPRSRVPGDVSHDDHAGAYRHEHPKDEGRELRSPQSHGPILRGRVPGTCYTCTITAMAWASFPPARWSGGIGGAQYSLQRRSEGMRGVELSNLECGNIAFLQVTWFSY